MYSVCHRCCTSRRCERNRSADGDTRRKRQRVAQTSVSSLHTLDEAEEPRVRVNVKT
jgi:hypothetical protein